MATWTHSMQRTLSPVARTAIDHGSYYCQLKNSRAILLDFSCPCHSSSVPPQLGTGKTSPLSHKLGSDRTRFTQETSTVYWCIASKLKVPLIFYWKNNTFCVLIYQFSISLTLAILQRQKSLPDIGGTTIQYVGCLATMGHKSTPWAYTSNFVQYISGF